MEVAPADGEYSSGTPGQNNLNTMTIPDAAPSIFHRVRATTADFWTVLEQATARRKSNPSLPKTAEYSLRCKAV